MATREWENQFDPRRVADINVPTPKITYIIYVQRKRASSFDELWIKIGNKNYQISSGSAKEILDKEQRVLRFIRDPLAPRLPSIDDFLEVAKRL